MTRLWICTSCGSAERLTMYPDCCSWCGGAMETQDGRSTCSSDDGSEFFDADAYESYLASVEADETDPACIIKIWHCGRALTDRQQSVLDELLLENRVAVFGSVFSDQREAA